MTEKIRVIQLSKGNYLARESSPLGIGAGYQPMALSSAIKWCGDNDVTGGMSISHLAKSWGGKIITFYPGVGIWLGDDQIVISKKPEDDADE